MSNSLFLALNGAVVVLFAGSLYGSTVSLKELLAAFLITFAVYGLNMVTDSKEDAINRTEGNFNRTRTFLFPAIAAMIVSLSIGVSIGVFAVAILATP